MRILMLSWRSPTHPQAGGAEVVTREILTRLAAWGHEVTWFSASYHGAPGEETVDGVRYVRRGAQWSVHALAWRWLRTRLDNFDRVVDQINTIPFLTPLYVDAEKRVFLIFQLAREYWFRQTTGVFVAAAPFGYLAEPYYLRTYRRSRGVTISESSRADLAALGIAHVTVMPPAVTLATVDTLESKSAPLRVVMISRLTPAKFFEEGLKAFLIVQNAIPDARLDVVGSGDPRYRLRLEKLAAELRLEGVVFHGKVDDASRRQLLRAAHVHLFASHREGWGLVVSEAGAEGTPSVGYDAPGVRDSIGDPGLLGPIGDVEALAGRILLLAGDPAVYEAARTAAWERSKELSADASARAFLQAIE